MTVIVWDGTTLAADRFCTDGYFKHPTTKIYKLPSGDLLGIAGSVSRAMALLDWAYKGFEPDKYPELADKENYAELLRIKTDGTILNYESEWPMLLECKSYAIGSGSDFAHAALYMGADAIHAVHVASELCSSCGMGVDSMRLHDVD